MALIHCIGDSPLADSFAKETAEVLVTAYPNHSWWVECKQGVLIVKHLEASGRRGLIGMLRKVDALAHDAGARKREILRAGGELLERAGLRRGPRGEDPVTSFELDDKKLKRYWHTPLQVGVIS
jgi:hypothetical protein